MVDGTLPAVPSQTMYELCPKKILNIVLNIYSSIYDVSFEIISFKFSTIAKN